jgi:hypothetical protein
MLRHRNRGKGAGSEVVNKSGYIIPKSDKKSTYRKLPAGSAGMRAGYVIHHSDNLEGGGSEIERPQSF